MEIDQEIENEIKTRLILAKYSEDDLIVHAYMLKSIKEVYKKYNLKIPLNIETYINNRSKNITHDMSIKLDLKKQELHEILKKKFNETISKPNNDYYTEIKTNKTKTSLFPDDYFKKK
jgi:hypothetical protein